MDIIPEEAGAIASLVRPYSQKAADAIATAGAAAKIARRIYNRAGPKPVRNTVRGGTSRRGEPSGVMAPVSIATTVRNRQPRLKNGNNSRVISHSELIGTISFPASPGTFTANKYAINPGLATTFPWLSTQAEGWEQYRFRRLEFHYVTRTATSTVGSVIMCADYDPSDYTPRTEVEAVSYQGAVESAPWNNIDFKLQPGVMNATQGRRYIRDGAVAHSTKLYDAANVFCCTYEGASAAQIGKLWVSYDVEFFVPRTHPNTDASAMSIFSSKAQTFTTTVLTHAEWYSINNPLAVNVVAAGSAILSALPKGAYLFQGEFAFKDTAAETLTANIQLVTGTSTALSSPMRLISSYALPANGQMVVSFTFFYVSDGTSVPNVAVTLTGAAGTLTVPIYEGHLAISVV